MKQKVLRLRFALTDCINDNIPKVKVLSELTLGELFDYALEVLLILMEIKQSIIFNFRKKVRSSDPFVLRILLFSFFYMFYGKVEIPSLPGIGLLHEARLWGLQLTTHAYP